MELAKCAVGSRNAADVCKNEVVGRFKNRAPSQYFSTAVVIARKQINLRESVFNIARFFWASRKYLPSCILLCWSVHKIPRIQIELRKNLVGKIISTVFWIVCKPNSSKKY